EGMSGVVTDECAIVGAEQIAGRYSRRLRRGMDACVATVDCGGGSHAAREIRVAPGAGSALDQRSVHAHCHGELLFVERDRAEDAGGFERWDEQNSDAESGSDWLAEALAGGGEAGAPGGEAGRFAAESPLDGPGCDGGRGVPAHHRSRRRAYGAVGGVREDDRGGATVVEGLTPPKCRCSQLPGRRVPLSAGGC